MSSLDRDECSALAAEIVLQCIQDATSRGQSEACRFRRDRARYDLQGDYMALLAMGCGVDPDAWSDYVTRIVGASPRRP